MRFIKGLESTCVSYGTLFNQTDLLITSRRGFHWGWRWPAPTWAHSPTSVHCGQFIVFCSDVLHTPSTGEHSSIILLKGEQWAFGDRWKTAHLFSFFWTPPPSHLAATLGLQSKHISAGEGCAWELTHGHRQMKGLVPCWWPQRSQDSTLMAAPCCQHLPHPAKSSCAFLIGRASSSLSLKHQVQTSFAPRLQLDAIPCTIRRCSESMMVE